MTSAAPHHQPSAQRRRTDRPRVLLSGKIVFDQTARSLDCSIRDLTGTGAKVRLSGPELLPARFFLVEVRRGVAHRARIVWSSPPEYGLAFEASHELNEACSPELRAIRRLWLDITAR